MDLTIIKIGGSVVTRKDSVVPDLNQKNIDEISRQLQRFIGVGSKRFVVIHGVGSFGHPIVKASGINRGIKTQKQVFNFAQTQKVVNQLNLSIIEAFQKNGIAAMPCQFSDCAVMKRGRIASFSLETIKGAIKLGLVPVGSGVPAYDSVQGCSILSGDQSAPYLAIKLEAKKIIVAGDTAGIYDKDPKQFSQAALIPEINAKNHKSVQNLLGGSLAIDVTGGMKQKYIELLAAAKKGIPSQIIYYKDLGKALAGEPIGTIIRSIE